MGQITVKADAILNAQPEDVYATIADYRQGHPRILPKENLYDLQVEAGGYGEGTVMRFKARTWGMEQSFHHRVTEPEPGKVLVEQDVDPTIRPQVTTTFTVTPVEQGAKSRVEISTTMVSSAGLKGLVERFVVSRANPPVYRKELKLLESVAQQRGASQQEARP
jgi:uncharacterized protein YndB with AHSA1/START domain